MPNTEKQAQAIILAKLGSRSDIRLFRNSNGFGYSGELVSWSNDQAILKNARKQTFGLCPGSADLIGLQRLIITPDMVGQPIAKFVSIEVKSERGRPTEAQANWAKMVANMGGYSVFAKDIGDVLL